MKGTVLEPGRSTFDPDLDLQPRRLPAAQVEPVEDSQRLIANPFLTVLAWLVVFALLRAGVRRLNLTVFMAGVVLLFVAVVLVQYHCLDCGATGWVLFSRSHACPAVVTRRASRDFRRFRGPGLKTQLVAWFVIIMAAIVLGMVVLGSR